MWREEGKKVLTYISIKGAFLVKNIIVSLLVIISLNNIDVIENVDFKWGLGSF
jgi:hypothetical protein